MDFERLMEHKLLSNWTILCNLCKWEGFPTCWPLCPSAFWGSRWPPPSASPSPSSTIPAAPPLCPRSSAEPPRRPEGKRNVTFRLMQKIRQEKRKILFKNSPYYLHIEEWEPEAAWNNVDGGGGVLSNGVEDLVGVNQLELQGDHSTCSKPPIYIKTKVPF